MHCNRVFMLSITLFGWGCKSTEIIEEEATVIVNGPYDIYYSNEKHLSLVVSYDKCPSMKEYFRLVATGDAGTPAMAPTPEQKKCISDLSLNSKVRVSIASTINHLSGLKSWNVIKIQNCYMNGIDGGIRFTTTPENKQCHWMQ